MSTRNNKRDRLLFVLPYMERGGTERHALHLMRRLRVEHDVALLAPPGPMLDDFLRLDIEYPHFPVSKKGAFRRAPVPSALQHLMDTFQPHVVHVHAAAELALLVRTVNSKDRSC